MSLWTSEEIAKATGGIASTNFEVSSLSIDTRSLQAGALFVPLKDIRDGHEFIPQAMASGASGCFSDRDLGGVAHIRVDDTLKALEALAQGAAKRSMAKRIAVTGSVGKTSVKDALAVMFAEFGAVHWSQKSFNNHWGVPLTLAAMPKETDYGVFEMGMNNSGEISALSTLVQPDIGLITTVAPAHLAHFKNVEAIADAKAEIIDGLGENGILILNGDNQYTRRIQAKAGGVDVMTFGVDTSNDVVILDSALSANGVEVKLDILDEIVDISLPVAGAHWVSNAAACMAVAAACGLDLQKAASALQGVKASPGRGDVSLLNIDSKTITLIDESYNANPTSMRAALSALSHRSGRRVVVLGDMYELGADEIALHAELSEPIEAAGVSRVIVTGECMRALRGALPRPLRGPWVDNAEDAYHALFSEIQDGDIVMVKGSNATGLGALTRRLKQEFAHVI